MLDHLPADAPICSSGKRPYRSEAIARDMLAGARATRAAEHSGRRPDAVEQGYYQCPVCHWWHLASNTRRARRSDLGNTKSGRGRRR